MTPITLIAIHCSATPNGRPHTAEDIHRWHLDRGWDGIGYHYVIELDGTRRTGRPEYWTGAHAGGHNRGSIGICLIGTDWFTLEQQAALADLLDDLRQRYPDAIIRGHRDLSPDRNNDGRITADEWTKTCPGFDARDWCKKNGIDPQ